MALSPGAMRYQVDIERPSPTQGPSGQPIDSWLLFARRRASREVVLGSERMTPQQQIARVPVLWKLRHLAGVDPSMRLLCEGKVYEIISAAPPPDGTKDELHISTLERVGESP